MNLENLQKLINVMERVQKRKDAFDISCWQDIDDDDIKYEEDELHNCGSAACVGGWLAVSPEWQEDGGYAVMGSGAPGMLGLECEEALAKWLDIPLREASLILGTHGYFSLVEHFYNSIEDEITINDVLNKLRQIRCRESIQ